MKFELKNFNRNVSDEELLRDLVLANTKLEALGRRLTFRSYREHGNYSAGTIGARFGSWNEGLKRAGLSPVQQKNISNALLFDNLKRVWISKGCQPVFRDMNVSPSLYSATTYTDRFGSWRAALQAFVKSVDHEEAKFTKHEVQFDNRRGNKKTKRDPSLSLRFFVLKRDNFRCTGCGRSPATISGLTLEVDHIVPWSEGGETLAGNLQALCYECNRGKAAHL